MKIAILTHPLYSNYGGILQAYALQKVLRDMGHDVVTDSKAVPRQLNFLNKLNRFIKCLFKKYLCGSISDDPFQYFFTSLSQISDRERQVLRPLSQFIAENMETRDLFQRKTKPSAETCNYFDTFIVGSDQIWRPRYIHTPTYFLDFLEGYSKKRIAYAASFGTDTINEFKPKMRKKCQAAALRFDAISVREDVGVDLCKNHFGVDAKHVLDPTFLVSKDDYLNLIDENEQEEYKNILTCYNLDNNLKKELIIDKIASALNLTPLKISPKASWRDKSKDVNDCVYPSISTWLKGFRDAKFVVTDSFHGTVFAIIFNKPFVSIVNLKRGASRFTSLLKIFNLESRLISSMEELTDEHLKGIDYDAVNKIKEQWLQKSMDFLKSSLS